MAVPPQLKGIQQYLRTAQEHENRDPVVSYYCRLYAMQAGMKLDSETPECRKFLVKLMDQLESMKKELGGNDSISQEVVGNAHIENYALKLFLYADNEDRSGHFHKNMVKAFYTASLLIDVLTVFGELSDENVQHRKYSRWKSSYIHNCLKSGETPQSGPVDVEQDEEADELYGAEGGAFSPPGPSYGESAPPYPQGNQGPAPDIGFSMSSGSGVVWPNPTNYNDIHLPPPGGAHVPANTPGESFNLVPMDRSVPPVNLGGHVHLRPEDFARAQKYCKYAGSALQYEDVPTAIQNLEKALQLLTTGKE